MNAETVLEAQTVALLRRLAREQEMRTRRARDEAAEQSREIVRRARSEARARVHEAVLQTRRDIELAIARRKAAIDTRERRARQAMLRRLLDDAWQRLPAALEARWSDREARRAWCRSACARAADALLDTGRRTVEIDPRWIEELGGIARAALADTAGEVDVTPVAGLGPGLRIRGGRACLDATIAGLLAARDRIAAEVHAEIDHALERNAAPEVTT
jgi:F0F1-type ATP synthase membrane subunit b/b'